MVCSLSTVGESSNNQLSQGIRHAGYWMKVRNPLQSVMEVEVGWLAIVSPAELYQVWSFTSLGGCNQLQLDRQKKLKQRTTKWRKMTCVSEFLVCGSAAVSERRPQHDIRLNQCQCQNRLCSWCWLTSAKKKKFKEQEQRNRRLRERAQYKDR